MDLSAAARMMAAYARLAREIEAAWAAAEDAWEVDEVATVGQRLADLQRLSPAAFERWVGDRFAERGYQVRRVGTHGTGGDHGIDLVVVKPDERAVVQCKNYRAWAVGEPALRDLFGVLHATKVDKAYLVTTGRVTQAAWRWARGKPIEIWDGAALQRLATERRARVTEVRPPPPAAVPALAPPPRMNCPKCEAALVTRRNRFTGELFLGCSRFPGCRHTQPMPPAQTNTGSRT